MQGEHFDIQSIRDSGWRRHYAVLLKRYDDQARFIARDYDFGDRCISVTFDEIDHANASVDSVSEGYAIQIASSFPYLLKALFSRVMAEPDMLSWVPMDAVEKLSNFEINYAVNAHRIGEQSLERLGTSVERERIALLLSDIAMEFVFLHEVAHILCGHVDAKRTLTPGASRLTEFSLTTRAKSEAVSLSRAWECEADLIGAHLLNTYVSTLIRHARSGALGNAPTALFGPANMQVEQCISLSLTALYVLFRFLRETSDRLDLVGFYPDPLVRAFAVRGALFQSMANHHEINKELLEDMLSARLEETSGALERIGIRSGMALDDEDPAKLQIALSELFATRAQHAPSLKEHRFFDWD